MNGPTHAVTVNKVMTETVGVVTEVCTHLCPNMFVLTRLQNTQATPVEHIAQFRV